MSVYVVLSFVGDMEFLTKKIQNDPSTSKECIKEIREKAADAYVQKAAEYCGQRPIKNQCTHIFKSGPRKDVRCPNTKDANKTKCVKCVRNSLARYQQPLKRDLKQIIRGDLGSASEEKKKEMRELLRRLHEREKLMFLISNAAEKEEEESESEKSEEKEKEEKEESEDDRSYESID